MSIGVSSQEMQLDPFSQMAQMNSRAMSHEHQLNQMHKNITYQIEKIKKEKHRLKEEKAKLKETKDKLAEKTKEVDRRAAEVDK